MAHPKEPSERPAWIGGKTRTLPSGTVTFLFTDIEGSTKLLREQGSGYVAALAEHRRIVRESVERYHGVEVDTQGDAFFVVFAAPADALAAAAEAQAAFQGGPIRVRMGLHTGEPELSDEGYVGLDVHLGARIAAAGHGGQVVLSAAARRHIGEEVSTITDLGEHRLKDFDRPVELFQLGDQLFPPLKTISNTNLPRPASSFVGRDREVGEVLSLLQDSARLVTLTGPGGSGKTRLAIAAAGELVPDFKAGVFWVGLATLRDPALVLETVGKTLGASGDLASHVGERELLLLLDNFEQVVEAAPGLADLLEACPNLNLVVTSRELLRVRGEVEYPVPPLADPEAVELFSTRARIPPSEEVAELCARLDNLPLAVELAAARTKAVTPILARQPCGPPSPGATTCSLPMSSACSPGWPCSPADAPPRRRRPCATPTSTRCSRWWRRAWFAGPTTGSGCWRPSESSPSSGSTLQGRPTPSTNGISISTWSWPCPAICLPKPKVPSGPTWPPPRWTTSGSPLTEPWTVATSMARRGSPARWRTP
jgi:class 3 adenylate cyclase